MTFVPDSSPDRITPGKALESAGSSPQPQKDFSSYMQDSTRSQPSSPPSPTEGPTPMGLSGAASPSEPPSMEAIAQQTKSLQDTLGNVHSQLNEPNLKLKRSQAHLLRNKLSGAHEYIRGAAQKVGVEPTEFEVPSGSSPLGRFIAYINDGQNQLIQVQQQLHQMSLQGGGLNPAAMLAVTVKMNLAQQELTYSSTLLGKVIDSIKQLMNVQL